MFIRYDLKFRVLGVIAFKYYSNRVSHFNSQLRPSLDTIDNR